jgi:hypothetical protein
MTIVGLLELGRPVVCLRERKLMNRLFRYSDSLRALVEIWTKNMELEILSEYNYWLGKKLDISIMRDPISFPVVP